MNKNRAEAFSKAVDAMENYLYVAKWLKNPVNQLWYNDELGYERISFLRAFQLQSNNDFGM